MTPRDKVLEEFLRDYLKLAPPQRAFAKRVMRELANGGLLEDAVRGSAN